MKQIKTNTRLNLDLDQETNDKLRKLAKQTKLKFIAIVTLGIEKIWKEYNE